MINAPGDSRPPKIFTPRRRRAILSFRRKGDVVWFVLSVGMFVAGATALGYTLLQLRRPIIVTAPPPVAAVEPPPVNPAAPVSPVDPAPLAPAPPPSPAAAPPLAAPPKKRVERPGPAPETPRPGMVLWDTQPRFQVYVDRNARLTPSVVAADDGTALRLEYDFQKGQWVQAYADVNRDLSRYSRVRFSFRGEGGQNTLEFKMVDADGTNVGMSWPRRTARSTWTVVNLPLKDLVYLWGGDPRMDWRLVRQIFFAVSRKSGDQGGKGRVWVKDVTFYER